MFEINGRCNKSSGAARERLVGNVCDVMNRRKHNDKNSNRIISRDSKMAPLSMLRCSHIAKKDALCRFLAHHSQYPSNLSLGAVKEYENANCFKRDINLVNNTGLICNAPQIGCQLAGNLGGGLDRLICSENIGRFDNNHSYVCDHYMKFKPLLYSRLRCTNWGCREPLASCTTSFHNIFKQADRLAPSSGALYDGMPYVWDKDMRKVIGGSDRRDERKEFAYTDRLMGPYDADLVNSRRMYFKPYDRHRDPKSRTRHRTASGRRRAERAAFRDLRRQTMNDFHSTILDERNGAQPSPSVPVPPVNKTSEPPANSRKQSVAVPATDKYLKSNGTASIAVAASASPVHSQRSPVIAQNGSYRQAPRAAELPGAGEGMVRTVKSPTRSKRPDIPSRIVVKDPNRLTVPDRHSYCQSVPSSPVKSASRDSRISNTSCATLDERLNTPHGDSTYRSIGGYASQLSRGNNVVSARSDDTMHSYATGGRTNRTLPGKRKNNAAESARNQRGQKGALGLRGRISCEESGHHTH